MRYRDRITTALPFLVMFMVAAATFDLVPETGAETKGKTPAAQKVFASPEEAAVALADAMRGENIGTLVVVLGPGSESLVHSGDPVADRATRERFLTKFDEARKIDGSSAGRVVLTVGKDEWPFPIPIVRKGSGWVFDTAQGKEEILARRIGRNELSTVQVMRAIVDAQREYAMEDRDGNGLLEYARKFWSDPPGEKNGLYWETKEGEDPSPLGPLAARARAEGYKKKKGGEGTVPYHGYLYRILSAQGTNAPGGAFDYLVKGKMIGGFAVVAYPAQYGKSGVMTFIVNHDGVVYERDLGSKSEAKARAMTKFDPGKGWKRVE